MSAQEIYLGKTYYFGWRNTPYKVIEISPGNNQYAAFVTLQGPRGGRCRAVVRQDDSVRKI